MTRVAVHDWGEAEWRGVSEVRRCPICSGSVDCSVHDTDEFACCRSTPSDWPLTNGAWLHRLASRDSTQLRAVG